MKRFSIEQSSVDIISHSGWSLIDQAIHSSQRSVECQRLRHGIKNSDVIKRYLALLSIGKNDFEVINGIESEFYFASAMDIDEIPGEAMLRQRMDKRTIGFLPIVEKASSRIF